MVPLVLSVVSVLVLSPVSVVVVAVTWPVVVMLVATVVASVVASVPLVVAPVVVPGSVPLVVAFSVAPLVTVPAVGSVLPVVGGSSVAVEGVVPGVVVDAPVVSPVDSLAPMPLSPQAAASRSSGTMGKGKRLRMSHLRSLRRVAQARPPMQVGHFTQVHITQLQRIGPSSSEPQSPPPSKVLLPVALQLFGPAQ